MSDQATIIVPRLSDAELVGRFRRVCKTGKVQAVTITLLGNNSIGEASLVDEPVDALKFVVEQNRFQIQQISFSASGVSINYYRGGMSRDGINDAITVHAGNQKFPAERRAAFVDALLSEFPGFTPDRAPAGANDLAALAAIHNSMLEQLQAATLDVLTGATEQRLQLDAEFARRHAASEEDFARRTAALEEAHTARLCSVEEQERKLEQLKKELDDKDHTTARRALRDQMLEDVRVRIQNFGVSTNTSSKRRPVFWGMVVVAVFALAAAVFSGAEVLAVHKGSTATSDSYLIYWAALRFTLATVGLIAALVWYTRWEQRWADQHAHSEFEHQRLYADIARSNWIVESCLEYQRETGNRIPSKLLEAITEGLFKPADASEPALHPADQLASALMGSASRLKLKVGDSELEFNKPGKTIVKETQ